MVNEVKREGGCITFVHAEAERRQAILDFTRTLTAAPPRIWMRYRFALYVNRAPGSQAARRRRYPQIPAPLGETIPEQINPPKPIFVA